MTRDDQATRIAVLEARIARLEQALSALVAGLNRFPRETVAAARILAQS